MRSVTEQKDFQSVQCLVWSVEIQGYLQVQVMCVMYTAQCAGFSVLPAKDEDLAVETGWVKLKFYLKKLVLKKPIAPMSCLKTCLRPYIKKLKEEN